MKESLLSVDPPVSSATTIFYTMAYTVLALLVYAYAAHQLSKEEKPLRERCEELLVQKESVQKENKELSDMVSSLSDPAADEYALITELGRIPKGTIKIIFSEPGAKKS